MGLRSPTLVLISGHPGSGKTSVGRPLAAELDLPLLSKDIIKEALASLTSRGLISVGESKMLGSVAFDVFFELLREGMSAVLDASRNPAGLAPSLRALPQRLIEVRCHGASDLARSRYIGRASQRHWVHADRDRSDDDQLLAP